MSTETIYHTDLRVDVHLDAYINVTRLAALRWRIGVLLQPRQSAEAAWWVNDAQVSVTFTGGTSVTAVSAQADAGDADQPRLIVPGDVARDLGYADQINARVRATNKGMTHARFDFTVDPDVRGMVNLGCLYFSQEFGTKLLHDADKFLTTVPFGTDMSGNVVVANARQEIWWTDELLEPGVSANMYYVVDVGKVSGEGLPCSHDWCNEVDEVARVGDVA